MNNTNYKHIEGFMKGEYGIGFLSRKKLSIIKLHEIKENLKERETNELRTLKSDANALGEWYKSLSYFFTILALIMTMFVGLITSTNQNQTNLNNALSDSVGEARVRTIINTKDLDPVLMEEQTLKMLTAIATVKNNNLWLTYAENALLLMGIIVTVIVILLMILLTSRKYFTVSILISEAIEEKKEALEKERVLKLQQETQNSKLEILRKERLRQRYKR